jgi:tetratricopeptide (TPR) repeat protein
LQAVRLDSGNAKLWAMLGEIYQRGGDDKRACQSFERSIALGGEGTTGTWQALTATYLRLGEVARADSLLQRVPPQVTVALESYTQGVRAREAGDVEGARHAFAIAAADSQAATAIVLEWGNAEFAAGHLDAAEGAYRRVLRTNPESHQAWNGLGVVQRRRGKLEDATRSFAHAVAHHPDDSAAQFNLAGTSLEAAQHAPRGARADSLFAVADASFAACVDLGFHIPEARLRRAEIQLLRGQPEAAFRQARILIADPSTRATARLLAGRAALAAQRPRDAVAVLAPAFRADSLSTDGMDLLGSAYQKLQMPADAARVLRRAHERDPTDWRTAMNLGVALSQSGDLAAAEGVLRPLATAYPREPDVLQNLAAVLQRRGKRSEADRLLRQAEALR